MGADTLPGEARLLGLKPLYPWPLSRWAWLTRPVRAERLAALRIGLALVMLFDVLFTFYLPSGDLFGPRSLGEPWVFRHRYRDDKEKDGKPWSLLRDDHPTSIEAGRARVKLLLGLWVLASFLLLFGLGSRLAAIYCWAMSVSVAVSNHYIDNAGDMVRTLTLFYLMLTPSGAAWSIEAWLRRRFSWSPVRGSDGEFRGIALVRNEQPAREPFYIHPWALRLIFVQMMAVYLFNGLYKSVGQTWHEGSSLYYVLSDLTLARWSHAQIIPPYWMTQILTWSVLWWEVLFAPAMMVPWKSLAKLVQRIPHLGGVHVLLRWNREVFLVFGALFHLGIFISMEIGGFALYMLCLYLPLVPWERFDRKPALPPGANASAAPLHGGI